MVEARGTPPWLLRPRRQLAPGLAAKSLATSHAGAKLKSEGENAMLRHSSTAGEASASAEGPVADTTAMAAGQSSMKQDEDQEGVQLAEAEDEGKLAQAAEKAGAAVEASRAAQQSLAEVSRASEASWAEQASHAKAGSWAEQALEASLAEQALDISWAERALEASSPWSNRTSVMHLLPAVEPAPPVLGAASSNGGAENAMPRYASAPGETCASAEGPAPGAVCRSPFGPGLLRLRSGLRR